MELFDTSAYKQHQIKSASDPAWDEPALDWKVGDEAAVLDDGIKRLVTITAILGKDCSLLWSEEGTNRIDSFKGETTLATLLVVPQTRWRRDPRSLAPILLEKLQDKSLRIRELSTELNTSIGVVEQCLEYLQQDNRVVVDAKGFYSLPSEEFVWELGDTCLITVNNEKHTGTVVEISRRICTVEYCDYFKEAIAKVSLDLSELVVTKQTHWRREAWGLSPILLENLQGRSCNSIELSLQLNLPIGDVSQCLEKLELQGLVRHSDSWIYSLVQEGALPTQECVEATNLRDSVTITGSASSFLASDSQAFLGTGISRTLTLTEQMSGQQAPHVSHSALEVNATPLMTPETVSQNFLEQSDVSDPSTSLLRTSRDYLTVSYDPEAIAITLRTSSRCFANSGTLSNGKQLVQRRSAVLGTVKDSLSLPTPTALSSIGKRCPGTSKLTDFLKAQGAIAYNQCENPVLLEIGMGLPNGWTDPQVELTVQEFQTREALRGTEEKLLGTDLIQQSQTSHSSESITCDRLLQSSPQYARDGNQLSIFPDTSDEPPDPDDYPSLKDYELAWNSWELQYPELAAAVQQRKILEEFESIPGDNPVVTNDSSVDWEAPYLAKPRDAIAYSKGQQGQLYHYGQRKNSKYGDVDSLYYWGYSYQIFDGFKWRSKSKSVPLKKLKKVRQLIEDKAGVATVLAFLGN